MTELDPNIILHATDRMPNAVDIMKNRQQLESGQQEIDARKAAIVEHQRAIAAAEAAQERARQVGGLAASGDLEGADKEALSAGDFDLHGHVKGLQDEHRAQLARKAEVGASVAYASSQLPYEQRKAAIQGATQQLVQAGWKPEEIAAFDPTDQNISQLVASTQSIKDAVDRHDKDREFGLKQQHQTWEENKPIALGQGGILVAPGGATLGGGGGSPAVGGAPGGFNHAVETVLHNEGGYNPSDMNGAPVNFGINQKANPGVDVKNLTRDEAKQIYHDKYWVPSGAENLPANLQTPYFDVYIRNPGFAKQALARSRGDPATFMQLSSAYFQKLAEKPSGQRYAHAWANRDANNTALATGGGEGGGGARVIASNPKPVPAETLLDEPTRALMADQYLAGDKSVLTNLGRGAQGAKNIVLLRQEIFKQSQQQGLNGAEIAKRMAQFNGLTASARTIGNIGGKVDYGVNELLQSIPLAQKASKALPRGQFVPVNRIQQMIQSGTSNPALKDFAIKTNAVINAYNLVAGRAGTDVEQRRHNANLLRTADSPEAYNAALAAMGMEGKVAQSASRTTMEGIGNPRSAPKPGTVVKGYRFKGGNPASKSSWEKAQ